MAHLNRTLKNFRCDGGANSRCHSHPRRSTPSAVDPLTCTVRALTACHRRKGCLVLCPALIEAYLAKHNDRFPRLQHWHRLHPHCFQDFPLAHTGAASRRLVGRKRAHSRRSGICDRECPSLSWPNHRRAVHSRPPRRRRRAPAHSRGCWPHVAANRACAKSFALHPPCKMGMDKETAWTLMDRDRV